MENHISWIELSLLVLEGLLLIFTISLLWMSIKEGRGRDNLILEVTRATKTLTQHEYFVTIMDTMVDAEKEVLGVITGRMPVGDEQKRTKELVLNIEKLVQNGVTVKYIMPRFQDRMHVGWKYSEAGAEVYYSTCAHVHDLRYTVVDGKISLLGVPEAVGEKEATRKGYRIPSEELAFILENAFLSCMAEAVSFAEFVRETVALTGAPLKTLSRELKIPENKLEKITRENK